MQAPPLPAGGSSYRVSRTRACANRNRPGLVSTSATSRASIASSRESRTSPGGRPVTRATTSRSKSRPWTEAAARLALAASESRLSRRPITCRIPSGCPRPQPAGLQATLGVQQAHQLADEVRVALGLAVDGGDQVGRRVGPGDAGDEAADLAPVEAGQRQVGGRRLAEQLGQGAAQRVAPVHLDVPVGADDQQARVGQLPGHEAEQQQARPVGPVEVVEHHHQAAAAAADRRQEVMASNRRKRAISGSSSVAGRRALQVGQLGQELGQLAHVGAELGRDLLRRAAGGIGAQGLAPGPVGGAPAPSRQRPQATWASRDRASAQSSSVMRVLPMPASPATSISWPWPP